LDEARGTGVILKGPADFRDATGKDVVTDERVRPDGADEAILGKNFVSVGGQYNEHLHHLGFEVKGTVALFYTVYLGFDFPVAKMEGTLQ
jgi:hypothetical protein